MTSTEDHTLLSRGPVKPKQLRSFGLLVGGVFGVFGLWPLVVRGEPLRLWALGLGVLLILPALVYPRVLTPFYHVWITAGNVLGTVMRPLIMGISFYLVITPIGFLGRLFGKDPMRLKSNPGDESYRIVRQPRPGDHMKHQF